MASAPIQAHGGSLVDRIVTPSEISQLVAKAKSVPHISINRRTFADLEMIAIGAFSPLQGFLDEKDYHSVVAKSKLADGSVWPIPIVLSVDAVAKTDLKKGQKAALVHDGRLVALIHVDSLFRPDKKADAEKIFKTKDIKHPGVAAFYEQGEFFVGGRIDLLKRPVHDDFPEYNLAPRDTRRLIQKRGWATLAALQTRNPIHRAHEYITKAALEIVDGLFIHPLVGETKEDDIPADVRMRCYKAVLDKYYPADRVLLAINPANMYYAGPREAVLHAIVQQNYGATHFIVGRDHAGVGDYYGSTEAQELIRSYSRRELAIEPMCFENAFWCRRNGGMATAKTSGSGPDERISLSGSRVREMLKKGEELPPEITRPEVAQILKEAMKE